MFRETKCLLKRSRIVCYGTWNSQVQVLWSFQSPPSMALRAKSPLFLYGSPQDPRNMLRGSVLWVIWIERNVKCFSNDEWSSHLRELRIFEVIDEAIKAAWVRTITLITTHRQWKKKFLARFDKLWVLDSAYVERNDSIMSFKRRKPLLKSFCKAQRINRKGMGAVDFGLNESA